MTATATPRAVRPAEPEPIALLPYELPELDTRAPLDLHRATVPPEWVDWNGHMNMSRYLEAFDFASGAFTTQIGMGRRYVGNKLGMTFVLEAHITYDREVKGGDDLRFTTQLLDHDSKRLHLFHQMYHAQQGFLAATCELMIMHIDHATRRPGPFPAQTRERLALMAATHGGLPRPAKSGRLIGIPKR
ncbi:MAG: thioesterase family protein [Rhodospirillales bacterium]|nr:thioesterase family protein [Rhodospirillales bacterium]